MIPRIYVDKKSDGDKIKLRLDIFLDAMEWKNDDDYILILWLERYKDNKKSGVELTRFHVNGRDSLITSMISMYIQRGMAICISKLRMATSFDSYEESIKKREMYGNNVLIYSKCEKMFLCDADNSIILFKKTGTNDYFNLDNIIYSLPQ